MYCEDLQQHTALRLPSHPCSVRLHSTWIAPCGPGSPGISRQVGAIHPLYLHSAMSDMSLPTSSCGRRASILTSQEANPTAMEAAMA
jgi:hypothetical protein